MSGRHAPSSDLDQSSPSNIDGLSDEFDHVLSVNSTESFTSKAQLSSVAALAAVGILGSAESARRSRMLSFIDKLHHLGYVLLQKTHCSICSYVHDFNSVSKDIELPRIAVIGQQSAGENTPSTLECKDP